MRLALAVVLCLVACRDNGWRCQRSHTVIAPVPVPVGCGKNCEETIYVMAPVDVCDEWVCVTDGCRS